MSTRKIIVMTVTVAMVLLGAVLATAQDKFTGDMQLMLEKLRADKKLLVSMNMDLTEAEAKNFWPLYQAYQDELFLIRVRTAKLISDYEAAHDKMTSEIARNLLNEVMLIETLTLALHQAYLPEFRKILPEEKVARYYQIENKVQAALMYDLASHIPLVKMAK